MHEWVDLVEVGVGVWFECFGCFLCVVVCGRCQFLWVVVEFV